MRTYVRLFFVSGLATLLLDVPFLVWHELPAPEVVGIACTIAIFGVFSAARFSSRARLFGGFTEEWQVFFAAFPATFCVILQALVVAGLSYYDTQTIIPAAVRGRIMLLAGVATFILSLIAPARLIRKSNAGRT